ncbi:MAG: TonB-dependent receptor plug domain-containing protein, partial [Pseudomonadota bacterium]
MAEGSVDFHKKTIYSFALATTFLWPVSALPQGVGETIVLDEVLIEGDKIGRTFDEIVPSIVVFTEEDLERPDLPTVFSVINSSPNVIADEDGTLPTVRGISSTVNTNQVLGSGVLPRVPILVDNVATGAAQSSGLLSNTAWDVSTVEVAKGPQATSTGQNAFSGAIRIFTNDPVFEP